LAELLGGVERLRRRLQRRCRGRERERRVRFFLEKEEEMKGRRPLPVVADNGDDGFRRHGRDTSLC
jgi:hypothetical protein